MTESEPSLPRLGGARVAIVHSERDEPSGRLADAAENFLRRAGARVERHAAPAAFEVAQLADWIAAAREADGIVACAAIVRGETAHDRHLGAAVTDSLLRTAVRWRIPVGNAVLTVDSAEQADARSGGAKGNRGEDAARAVAALLGRRPGPLGVDLGPRA